MDLHAGDLVKVDAGGPVQDGIVYDLPSAAKVVVGVVDAKKGPTFRTVSADTLSERAEEAPTDKAVRMLIHRSPPPTHPGAGHAGNLGHGASGHPRGAPHRSNG